MRLMNATAPATPCRRRRSASQGFTLIELMVTVAILGIVLALGVPSFVGTLAQNRMATQTNELVASLNLARMEAVRRSQSVTLRAVDTATTNTRFEAGWKVFTDTNGNGEAAVTGTGVVNENTDGFVIRDNGALAGATTVRRVSRIASGGSPTYSGATGSEALVVTFNSRGATARGAPAFFKICDSGKPSLPGRIVQVSSFGKISLASTTIACP